ncbi:MAG: HEPN domain-containing protein [Planctomycetes bacterium]|nr:HEPN domain-containing protein [Planctomycetota bacterium]
MSEIEKEILKKVMQWLSLADEDLNLASHALGLGVQSPHRLIAYHAQQCAEKYLKAFLVYHNVDFPYTHSIRILLKLCSNLAAWAQTLKDAEQLSPYAITARYPGEDQEVTEAEAKQAIELARKVRTQVRNALEQLGLKLPE